MSNLLTVLQSVALNAVNETKPAALTYGTVTKTQPLEIRLDESTLSIGGSSILLTESVIEKKLTINKHNHPIGNALSNHIHSGGVIEGNTGTSTALAGANVDDIVIDGVCSEFGQDLPTEKDASKIVITLNRALEQGDKVMMLRVMSGQQFIVLSRIFDSGED